jgi:hypothetical protein
MSCVIAWIHGNADFDQKPETSRGEQETKSAEAGERKPPRRVEAPRGSASGGQQISEEGFRVHQFPGRTVEVPDGGTDECVRPHRDVGGYPPAAESAYEDPERRVYRGRTIAMLRRYLKYSIETGRLPSVLGREFFRAKVTSYSVGTFEDRVIFVHDMEICLQQLDEFSRQLIGRHILQEHDHEGTARLLHCNEKTVRRLVPMVLDQLSEILLDKGLMESLDPSKKSCQEGEESQNSLSHCEDGENKF